MLINRRTDVRSSEITPKTTYINRRKFLLGASVGLGGLVLGGRVLREIASPSASAFANTIDGVRNSSLSTTGEKLTPLKDIANYNNYYEFSTNPPAWPRISALGPGQ
jgi:sulfoxide reductase catalytic subunit YedY